MRTGLTDVILPASQAQVLPWMAGRQEHFDFFFSGPLRHEEICQGHFCLNSEKKSEFFKANRATNLCDT